MGRRILNVRVCSCPKRDKEKEEKDTTNKTTAPQGKKRKLDMKEKKATADMEPSEKKMYNITVGVNDCFTVVSFKIDLFKFLC